MKQDKKKERLKKKLIKTYTDSSESEEIDSESDIGVDFEFKIPTNTWIIKPGENSNWGNGITVCKSLNEIKSIIKSGQEDYG